MKRLTLLWIVIGFVLAAPGSLSAQTPPPADRLTRIDAHVEAIMAELDIPGVAIAVVDDGEILYQQGYGIAAPDGRPMTPETVFMLASLSKSFTALAVMQQVEAGTLDLDAPVTAYLDWFAYPDITLRHLLHHTSGFTEFGGQTYFANPNTPANSLDATMRAVTVNHPPVFAPGEGFEYSNINYDLLGLLVETVSGQPYADTLQTHIFEPLGMTHSYANITAAQADNLTTGYIPIFGVMRPQPLNYNQGFAPSAGVFSTAADMAKYHFALLNGGSYGGGQVLSTSGVQALFTPGHMTDRYWGYGMGWWRGILFVGYTVTAPDVVSMPQILMHEGDGNAFRTFQSIIPSAGQAVVVLANSNDQTRKSTYVNLLHGINQIMAGVETLEHLPPSEDAAHRYGEVLALALAVLWVGMALLAGWHTWQLWQHPGQRPTSARRIAATIGVPLLLDIVILVLLYRGPEIINSPYSAVPSHAPNLYGALVVLLLTAGLWGAIRTGLWLWLLVIQRPVANPNLTT